MIRNRPQAVKDRQAFGHWEADLMIFRKEQGRPT
jgi:transposase, IS30 family